METSDVSVYSENPEKYEDFQNARPDYVPAIECVIEQCLLYLSSQTETSVADFCGGTGAVSHKISQRSSEIKKITLVDINSDFLEQAQARDYGSAELVTIHSDILHAHISSQHDIVLAIFAYHHVPDNQKMKFLEKVKEVLKPGGVCIVAEIYLSSLAKTKEYYRILLKAIPGEARSPGLEQFLMETAESSDFEYKVSKSFAKEQFLSVGFKLLFEKQIYPLHDTDEGTFVQIYEL